MTEYQRITLKESGEQVVVSAMEYPYGQAGILYIKFITYNEFTLEPEKFLTVQPQDVFKREYEWSQEAETELIEAAEKAKEEDARNRITQMGYQKAMREEVEKEMQRRSSELAPPPEEGGDLEGLFG